MTTVVATMASRLGLDMFCFDPAGLDEFNVAMSSMAAARRLGCVPFRF